MKLRLSTWNILLLGSSLIAANYILLPGTRNDLAGRAVATGILLYLIIPVIILLVVDSIKLYRRFFKKGTKS